MVEGIVGAGLLAAIGLGVMKLSDSQKKAVRGQKQVSELPRAMVMIKQLTSDKDSCEVNFKGKNVKASLTELKDADSKVQFKQGEIIGKGEYRLIEIKLDGYSEDTNRVRLSLSFDKLQEGATSSKVNRFTFIHAEANGGTISKCLDPSEMSSESLVKRFCKDIDPAQNDDCEDNLSNLMLNVKELYCGKNHPFLKFDEASGKCLPLDANKACGSGYIQGYDSKGELICYTPSGGGSSSKGCTSWSAWGPSASGTCTTATITQTRSCTSGESETQAQIVAGTKVCDESCKEWNDWTPLANTQCPDNTVSQARSCKTGAGSETRVVKGEKTDCGGKECTVVHPIGWTDNQWGNCRCQEFQVSAGYNGQIKSVLKDGESKVLSLQCTLHSWTQEAGYSQGSTGSLTIKCVNGEIVSSNGSCGR